MKINGISTMRPLTRFPTTVALSLATALWPTGAVAGTNINGGDGYRIGDEIPVSCLNRTVLGRLQYIPFFTCNETARPLSLRYGVSETIACTIPELSDTLYHLLEFYVHSDVPMTCRVPTSPLSALPTTLDGADSDSESGGEKTDPFATLSDNGPPFTPITIALQGTLQLSHLHIWSDMNMLMHDIASDPAAQPQLSPAKGNQRGSQSGQPGYVIAGTAYSTPEFEVKVKNVVLDEDEEPVAVAQGAREPWTLGHGAKVIRGEPLTFSFHVAWLEGGAGIGWPERSKTESFLGFALDDATGSGAVSRGSGSGSFFSRMLFFVMAASVGALVALYWERNGQSFRGKAGWRGDGILGAPPSRGTGSSVTFGNGGRNNGYGGYSASTTTGAGANGNGNGNGNGSGYGGYGGFPTGKRD
ncbi:hypothetical protein N7454_011112 [Penicillium verhagenii]|nr:hypothetical protein N7454_011112 [Penicillium verhagenii]